MSVSRVPYRYQLSIALCSVVVHYRWSASLETYQGSFVNLAYSKLVDSGRGTILNICHQVIKQEVIRHTCMADEAHLYLANTRIWTPDSLVSTR